MISASSPWQQQGEKDFESDGFIPGHKAPHDLRMLELWPRYCLADRRLDR